MKAPGILWSGGEASAVNEFLNTPVGRKWLVVLMTRKPGLDLSSSDRAALTGAFAGGYEHFFREITLTRGVMDEPENMSAKAIDPTRD
jgi:hypothetical protein